MASVGELMSLVQTGAEAARVDAESGAGLEAMAVQAGMDLLEGGAGLEGLGGIAYQIRLTLGSLPMAGMEEVGAQVELECMGEMGAMAEMEELPVDVVMEIIDMLLSTGQDGDAYGLEYVTHLYPMVIKKLGTHDIAVVRKDVCYEPLINHPCYPKTLHDDLSLDELVELSSKLLDKVQRR
ncbi:hypothetical protein WJX72_012159 [[Myrmecia] bisecta]|uniref:Uncharacterized protein n=1 Tax=[Myrmecia] bisecta TaxID=41462 RepID=A0AAW1QT96_9CHLO